jgi:large subunit ribosomal protein L29
MAKLNAKEIRKLSQEERTKKLEELKMELVKARIIASKTGSSKAKDIRKLIARIITINKEHSEKNPVPVKIKEKPVKKAEEKTKK